MKKLFFCCVVLSLVFFIGSLLGDKLYGIYYNTLPNHAEINKGVLVDGDVEEYKTLKGCFCSLKKPEKLLFYSMVMAKQHGYEPAGEDVCNIINEWYDSHPALGPKGKRAQFLLEEFGHQKASQQD